MMLLILYGYTSPAGGSFDPRFATAWTCYHLGLAKRSAIDDRRQDRENIRCYQQDQPADSMEYALSTSRTWRQRSAFTAVLADIVTLCLAGRVPLFSIVFFGTTKERGRRPTNCGRFNSSTSSSEESFRSWKDVVIVANKARATQLGSEAAEKQCF